MGKVGGAVERIHIPAKITAGFPAAAFFRDKIVFRPLLADALDDHLFRAAVGLRDQINVALILDGNLAEE